MSASLKHSGSHTFSNLPTVRKPHRLSISHRYTFKTPEHALYGILSGHVSWSEPLKRVPRSPSCCFVQPRLLFFLGKVEGRKRSQHGDPGARLPASESTQNRKGSRRGNVFMWPPSHPKEGGFEQTGSFFWFLFGLFLAGSIGRENWHDPDPY